ncbi:MAG: phosphonate metabolism transcriptional regulator PhnF [Rhodobacteraceae bacterium]|nr:phosphonate metabolism transcriptional regulator PhnF [Paracoccaceae bacterium]
MKSTPIWQAIAGTLRQDIVNGHYGQGAKLPTEATLSNRFGVNRHTVRHALKTLAEEGLVQPRRGAGVFVIMAPTDYPIGRRVRYHQNLRAAGRVPAKNVLLLETRPGNARECAGLALPLGESVHVYEGLSLADGQPIAIFRSVFPALRFAGLIADLRAYGSVSTALRLGGVADYTRASTRLNAKLATATQAVHLKCSEGAPILRSIGINVDADGKPVEYGRTWFSGDRVTLTLADD